MELILADMAQLERRILKCSKDVKTFGEEIEILKKASDSSPPTHCSRLSLDECLS
jgi:hypothetical protein